MLKFQLRYLAIAILLLFVEVYIALYVHDAIVRPHIGDLLVVIMLYCFIRAIFRVPVLTAAFTVLIFAYTVEILQYFHFIKKIDLHHSKLATLILGNSFSWIDMIAYTVGIAFVLLVEKKRLESSPGK